ncbi:MAG TPA: hypothetical protein VK470_02770 [Bacteroidota bacterium]|nr:hypothetical protein [Bacteroidota bacterium]
MTQAFKKFVATNLVLVLIAGLSLFVGSCEKPAAPDIKEWAFYQNTYGMEFQYPKGWQVIDEANVIKIYPSPEVAMRFGPPPQEDATSGVEIRIGSEKFKAVNMGTLAAYKDAALAKVKEMNTVDKEWTTTVRNEPADVISYHAKIGSRTTIYGKRVVIAHDSSFYYVNYEAFNEDFEAYQPYIDSVVASLKFPKPKANYADPNAASKPSAEFARFSGQVLDIQYPENFDTKTLPKKGKTEFALNIQGLRQDCNIVIDVFPAEKLNIDKVFEQNKGSFKPQQQGNTKIDGNDARFLVTSVNPTIERKVYFTVKNDKVYRVILTWYKPMAADFLPAFEKAVSTLKIK